MNIFYEGDILRYEVYNFKKDFGNGFIGYKMYKVLYSGDDMLL